METQELKEAVERLEKENAILRQQVSWWNVRCLMLHNRLAGILALSAGKAPRHSTIEPKKSDDVWYL